MLSISEFKNKLVSFITNHEKRVAQTQNGESEKVGYTPLSEEDTTVMLLADENGISLDLDELADKINNDKETVAVFGNNKSVTGTDKAQQITVVGENNKVDSKGGNDDILLLGNNNSANSEYGNNTIVFRGNNIGISTGIGNDTVSSLDFSIMNSAQNKGTIPDYSAYENFLNVDKDYVFDKVSTKNDEAERNGYVQYTSLGNSNVEIKDDGGKNKILVNASNVKYKADSGNNDISVLNNLNVKEVSDNVYSAAIKEYAPVLADVSAFGSGKMLVMKDSDGSGGVDGSKIFGVQTVSPFTNQKLNASDGYEALAEVAYEAEQYTGIKCIKSNGEVDLVNLKQALQTVGVDVGFISEDNVVQLEDFDKITSVNVSKYIKKTKG